MILLAFETASPSGGVALLRDGAVVGEARLDGAPSHSRECLAAAEALLSHNGLAWRDVDALAASHGPGAFTGVRVGLAIVKGLAWSLARSCITVSSLEALATPAASGLVVPVLDARVGEVYFAIFSHCPAGLVRETADSCDSPDALSGLLVGRRAIFRGEGARRYFDSHLAGLGELDGTDALFPTPAATGALAWRAFQRGEAIPPDRVAAVYLRDATTPRLPAK